MPFNYNELNRKQQYMFDYNNNLGKTIDDIVDDDTSHIAEPMDKESVRQIVKRNINNSINDTPSYPSNYKYNQPLDFN